jgi:ribosomal protein S18 acetylase RimI-like enzyme
MSSVAYAFEKSLRAVTPVAPGRENEILSFLAEPTLTNVIMSGFIRDNGLVSQHNRGRFYAYRNERDEIEGVALIGHTVLFESTSERAVSAFAAIARCEPVKHLLMGEHDAVERFWKCYSDERQSPRQVCPVLFLRHHAPFNQQQQVLELRPAEPNDLEHVVRAQAAMAFETSGVDPLQKDPLGFRQRYLRRIDKKRVWVLMKDGRLVFKTDVIADTPEATYIEGVYVSPDKRGKGLGRSCVSELGRIFLERSKGVYLFVENDNTRTMSFYLKLGFDVAGQYELLYF